MHPELGSCQQVNPCHPPGDNQPDMPDARAVVDAGADAVVVSNHGGRQLDRAATPLEALPSVVDAVGDRAEVYVDGGVISGSDVVAAVARGRGLPWWDALTSTG